ncbi:type II toxin-antitoxin system CcdA family antitoxin [Reyranella sp.]|uniref:type II toxin-antitoxin system CcdA family antitoxin n=1 Tax=Reyranella sp. TaxID=1929291 RepID=UPI003783BC9B
MPRRTPQSNRKQPVTLRVRGDLLVAARRAGIDLSATLERALIEQLAETRRRWLEENREAIAAYNERVERYGVFTDGLRRW